MDLVLVSARAAPPVARIVEWDKVVYGLRKKEKAAERSQREHRRLAAPKEVRVGCHTAEHDLLLKVAQARRFLGDGHHLRLAVTFKGGREVAAARQRLGDVLNQLQGAQAGWGRGQRPWRHHSRSGLQRAGAVPVARLSSHNRCKAISSSSVYRCLQTASL